MNLMWTLLMSALAASASADAKTAPEATKPAPNVSIRAADLGAIRDWTYRREDSDDVLYIQDRTRNWYRATFFGVCPDLGFTDTIGFVTDATGSLDRFAAVAVHGRTCTFQTLTKADGPPAERVVRTSETKAKVN